MNAFYSTSILTAYLVSLLLFSFITTINAGNTNWTGGGGTADWNDAANWSMGVPGANDRAIFDNVTVSLVNNAPSTMPKEIKVVNGGSVTFPFDLTVNKIEVTGVPASSAVFDGALTVTGGNGEIRIADGSTGTFNETVVATILICDDALGGTFNFSEEVTVEELEIKNTGDKMVINTNGAVVTVTNTSSKTNGNLIVDGAIRFQMATTYKGSFTNENDMCADATFTVTGTMINNGTMCFEMDLVVSGILDNSGTIDVTGTFTCSGTCSGNSVGSDPCDCSFLLPIKLISFSGRITDDGIQLEWETAVEIDNAGFDIERGHAGIGGSKLEWKMIGFINGNGSTTNIHNYKFLDTAPFYGINYYRLKQNDYNGQYQYTPIISVEATDNEDAIAPILFPNPTRKMLTIQMISDSYDSATILIFNLTGKLMFSDEVSIHTGRNIHSLDVGKLSCGIYLSHIITSGRKFVQPVVRE